jgi:hypothetical protein
MSQKPPKSSTKSPRVVKVYTCGVDWQHEIGEVSDMIVYPSVASLKKHRSCWSECGIVELDVTLSKWIEPQDLFKNLTDQNGNPMKVVKKQLTDDQKSDTVIKKEIK